MTSGKKLPELYTIIISINSFLLPLWWLLTPLTHVAPPWCSSTSTAFCKSRVIFAWGDVTCAAYSEPNDCVLLSTYRVWLRSLNRSSLPSSRIQRIKDSLLCAPQGAVGRRAALPTPISEAFLPAAGAVHTSAGPEGRGEGCRAARGEERRGKTMGAHPDGKTPSARAEHLLRLRLPQPFPGQGHSPRVSPAELRPGGDTLILFPTGVFSWVKPTCANTPHSPKNPTCHMPHPTVPWPLCLAPAMLPLEGARHGGRA